MRQARGPLRLRIADHLAPVSRPLKPLIDLFLLELMPARAERRLERDRPEADSLIEAVRAIRGRGLTGDEREWISAIERRREAISRRREPEGFTRPHLGESEMRIPADFQLLAHRSSIHAPWGRFLLKLARESAPGTALELGSAVGISAAYLAAGFELAGAGRLISIESSPELSEIAREGLRDLGLTRAEVVTGRLEDELDDASAELGPMALVFCDASKSAEQLHGTIDQLVPNICRGGLLVIDDIHWSRELASAWRELRSDGRFDLSCDLGRIGVLRTNR